MEKRNWTLVCGQELWKLFSYTSLADPTLPTTSQNQWMARVGRDLTDHLENKLPAMGRDIFQWTRPGCSKPTQPGLEASSLEAIYNFSGQPVHVSPLQNKAGFSNLSNLALSLKLFPLTLVWHALAKSFSPALLSTCKDSQYHLPAWVLLPSART